LCFAAVLLDLASSTTGDDLIESMDIENSEFRFSSPALGADDVHLWRINLEATAKDEPRWSTVLSTDEQAHAARFRFQKDRRYYTAARAILRQVLAGYLEVDPRALTFAYSAKEKPALGGIYSDSELAFNISHSGGIALFACTRNRQIGVDVEQIRSDFDTDAIARRFFSEAERQELASLPAAERHEAFFRVWTRKEAYIKATGDGLSLPLQDFDVSLVPGHKSALLATRPNAQEAKRWSLRDIRVKPGYAGALCVSGTGWRLVDGTGCDRL
jgi:4'-phosphopantetheinyl transferase